MGLLSQIILGRGLVMVSVVAPVVLASAEEQGVNGPQWLKYRMPPGTRIKRHSIVFLGKDGRQSLTPPSVDANYWRSIESVPPGSNWTSTQKPSA